MHKNDILSETDLSLEISEPLAELILVDSFETGAILAGRYQVLSVLGRGGNGIVYRVKEIPSGEEFALKTVAQDRMSETSLARFQHEAKTTFSVDHPNVVSVRDYGVLEDGTPFLVMELLKGVTLRERLRTTGPLPVARAIPIFAQICLGLAYAHELGVVHRDIKPSNIILVDTVPEGSEGSVKIVDFGIAKLTQQDGGELQQLTRTGEVFGSPLYMSPEQCAGTRVDQRSDIYSVGCVLFEALTGALPFVGETALSTMMKHLVEKPPTLKESTLGESFPAALEQLIAGMLDKSPDARYKNLGLVALDLGALARGADIAIAPRVGAPASGKSSNRPVFTSTPLLPDTVFLIAVSCLIFGAVMGFLVGNRHDRNRMHPSERPLHVEEDFARVQRDNQAMRNALDEPAPQIVRPSQLIADGSSFIFKQRYRELPAALFKNIAGQASITQLDIASCTFTNSGLKYLANSNISNMNFSSSSFNDEGARALLTSRKLKTLSADFDLLSGDGVSSLCKIKSLENLYIAGAQIDDSALKQIAAHKRFNSLALSGINTITNAGLASLENMEVAELDLSNTCLHDTGLRHLSKIKGLTKLSASGTNVTIDGVRELLATTHVTKVQLANCPQIGLREFAILWTEFPNVQIEDKQKEIDGIDFLSPFNQ